MLEEKEKAAQKEKDLQERDHGVFLSSLVRVVDGL